jgi:hypothetical protein
MSSENIRAKITDLFKTGFTLAHPTIKVDYENTKFDQPSGAPWVRLSIIDGLDRRENLGNETRFRTHGVVNIQIQVPENTGTAAMRAIQDSVKAIFLDRQVPMTGGSITFCNGDFKGPRQINGWYSRSYQIEFYARWTMSR